MLERIIEGLNRIDRTFNDNIVSPYKKYFDTPQRYETTSFLPKTSDAYSSVTETWDGKRHYSGNDLIEIVLRNFELNRVKSEFIEYSQNLGNSLVDYLESKGMNIVDIVGIASANLGEGVVAAIQRSDKEGLLIANKNYSNVITAFAYSHGLSYDEARQFVWDHELIHGAQVDSEEDVFKTQFNYYKSMAETSSSNEDRERYTRLATAANSRYTRERDGKEESN